ncbi:Mrp/NBP35 family ATP-binding protein [Blattabacterium cuenoti]|uniref:Mrp/NBP35 family ATP-binding protein n=1 Tax=Blattabacterium cuenoti TaxID=1653831 RepID=UPI00163C146E|nr:Mrp/NBP35 family ATP-binding protein [Blattabacterium cuenoti]
MVAIKKKIEKALNNIIKYNCLKKIDINNNMVIIYLSLYYPTMHLKKKLTKYIKDYLNKEEILSNEEKKISIKIEMEVKNKESKIKNIIAVASGKGGVGKSTIATNIAVTLVKMGFSVGLLDADIYGPSIPLMFNIKNDFVDNNNIILTKENGSPLIKPVMSYQVKIISIGLFLKYGEAVVWRGPMVTKALIQLIHETDWGKLDFLIIDLPPGTGDIHLSLLQETTLKGVIIVSTSQRIALSDVNRTVEMFRIKSIYVPILGIIENMSYFLKNREKNYFFGKDGVKNFSKKMNISFLGEVPMLQEIQEYSDMGIPIVLENENVRDIFIKITKNIVKQLKKYL